MIKKSEKFTKDVGSQANSQVYGNCHTPIFDLRLYSGGVSLINGVQNCVNKISTRNILFGNDKLIN